ncbi:poly-beta-1,6-N-acetyl-D-glucosamine synthase [bacterium BMS3Abin02]|nr:poly-beta-1,6-N-acetyl-D-glucosamine synthase [bacterium BMS3Abin02]GBE21613.1 poly-beta-1,6-N-acetyl-D-glucosamine synthase [bacterium BMS3Bbin01]HDH24933.1 glycosyltransferase family 2 protein [Actinomycetota bacterium]HDK45719.1 glycosyltransferase family 2 protein [Actinomycetota bacterium]
MDAPLGGVTAIVAAYNEAPRIGRVLDVLTTYPGFEEVIVVDDGSTDGTEDVVAAYPVTYLRIEVNQGKGHAMDVGVARARTDVIFFADADIVGLTHQMIAETVQPVLDGSSEMFILMRNRKIYYLRLLMHFIPLLGGERAITKRLWYRLPDRYKVRFRIEAGLNFYAVYYGKGLRYRVFRGISQTVKEEKYGFWLGLQRRLRMFGDIVLAAWDLQRNDVPATVEGRRSAALGVVASVIGLVSGLFIVAATLAGPVGFIRSVFAHELREDPGAPLVRWLESIASGVSAPILLVIGLALVVLNLLFFTRALVRLVSIGRIRSEG